MENQDTAQITKLVESIMANKFTEMELSSKSKEISKLRAENENLIQKLSCVEIPAEKVEEITAVVEKALDEKLNTLVGDALKEVIGKVEKLEETVEESKTDRERIKEALSEKEKSPFQAMSQPAKAYTGCADAEKELESISDTLKNAKTEKELEEVKSLLQAFIKSSSKRIESSEVLDDEERAELEAYKVLGTIEEIEAAVEVLETYAEEIGNLKELKEEKVDEEENKEEKVREEEKVEIKDIISKRKAQLSAKKEAIKAKLSSKEDIIKARRLAISSKVQRVKEAEDRKAKLSALKEKIKRNIESSSVNADSAGALATSLFQRKSV